MEKEVSVQSLLDRIKEEGIEAARKTSEEILEKARSEAEDIIRESEQKGERIIAAAEEEAKRIRQTLEKDMEQRGRDLILAVRNEIIELFDRILQREVASSLSPGFMKEMILKILQGWKLNESSQFEILAKDAEASELEEHLFKEAQEELKKGIVVRPVKGLGAGFRIGERGGNMVYDFTEEAVADILKGSLNPRIAEFLGGTSRKD
ncbi:MAG: hypothetical protein JRH06_02445 [Deltaproteobacteria bacterium]|nr:hypothetical protein [Deltaproteobacteria bacterium]MBW2136399.1 hypothetical protein [Deltaproteobacteria bacterium]